MKQKVVGIPRDDDGGWLTELECGHTQHVRHQPPWQNRPWVTTEEGRRIHLDVELDCKKCDNEKAGGRTSS